MGVLGKMGKENLSKMGGRHFVKCVEDPQRRNYINKRSKIFKNVQKLYTNIQKTTYKHIKTV